MLVSLIVTLGGAALLVAAAFAHSVLVGLMVVGAVVCVAGLLLPEQRPRR